MYELTTTFDASSPQSLADLAELGHRHHRHYRRRRYSNTCLITANYSLNGISILNILNNFGGW